MGCILLNHTGALQTLNSVFTFIAARLFPSTIHVRIVSLILESTKMACLVVTSNSCWILHHLSKWSERIMKFPIMKPPKGVKEINYRKKNMFLLVGKKIC